MNWINKLNSHYSKRLYVNVTSEYTTNDVSSIYSNTKVIFSELQFYVFKSGSYIYDKNKPISMQLNIKTKYIFKEPEKKASREKSKIHFSHVKYGRPQSQLFVQQVSNLKRIKNFPDDTFYSNVRN